MADIAFFAMGFIAGADKSVSAWNVQYEKLIRKYKDHNGVIHNVSTPKNNN